MVDRIWVWTCDACGRVENRRDYGLPRGWIFVKAAAITHRCEACKTEVPPAQRGTPRVVAAR